MGTAMSLRELVSARRRGEIDDVAAELQLAHIDFVRCDVEGGEFGFLRGAKAVLDQHRPTVPLEMLRKWTKAYGYHPNDIIEWMKPRGYICAGISPGSIGPIATVTDATAETNFLFVHADRITAVATILRPEFTSVIFD
jgi:hypothetical protein